MVVKNTMMYLTMRYCGKCGERKKVTMDSLYCPEPYCHNRLRCKPRKSDQKEKYIDFEGY